MSNLVKIILYAVVGWIIVLGLVFIPPMPLLSGLALPFSLAVGFVLFILAIISLFIDHRKTLSLVVLALVIIVTVVASTMGLELGAWVHLKINQRRYEAQVARILSASNEAERRSLCSFGCISDEYSNRVAFHYACGVGCLRDFYLIYTPSVDGSRMGGKLFDLDHLSGAWYIGLARDAPEAY
jgi:hypothetical protein